MLGELLHTFKRTAKLDNIESTLWSDSQIVLAWLKKDAATLQVYVNNRVQRIQEITADVNWRLVPSADNPADLLSRGTTSAELQNAALWWKGPFWLSRGAWLFRFIFNSRQRNAQTEYRRMGPLSNAELETALEFWVREEQRIYYAKEIKALEDKQGIDSSSPVAACTPRIDEKGLLRLNGRVGRASIPYQQKNPFLLPDVSPLAKLLIREAHERTLHGGSGEITNLRRAVRKHNWKCVTCTRYRRQATTQM